jgi:hypothetical protein
VQDDPVGRELHAGGQGQLAGRAHVQAQALVVDDAGHGPGQQRLAGVGDVSAVEGLAVRRATDAELGQVEYVGRRAVLRGDADEAGPPTDRSPPGMWCVDDGHSQGSSG